MGSSTVGSSGRLEVYYNDQCGGGGGGGVSLCGKSFNYTEAVVACKQLHYDTANSYGTANALGSVYHASATHYKLLLLFKWKNSLTASSLVCKSHAYFGSRNEPTP